MENTDFLKEKLLQEQEQQNQSYISLTIEDFALKMNEGKFFLQDEKTFGKPNYAINLANPKFEFNGLSEITIMQKAYERNVLPQVLTPGQIAEKDGIYKRGTSNLALIGYENFGAKYKENKDETNIIVTQKMVDEGKNLFVNSLNQIQKAKVGQTIHIPGERKINSKGEIEPDFKYGIVFPAQDIYQKKYIQKVDEEGNPLRYTETTYKKDTDGNVLTYSKDREYENKNSTPRSYKKGDPVVDHEEGALIYQEIKSKYTLYKILKDLPKKEVENMAQLYKPLNNSPKETFYAKLVEGFNAMYTGAVPENKKIDFTKEEINYVKEMASHPRQLNGIIKSAQSRAVTDVNTAEKIDSIRATKANKNSAENTNTNTNEQTNQTKSKKSR